MQEGLDSVNVFSCCWLKIVQDAGEPRVNQLDFNPWRETLIEESLHHMQKGQSSHYLSGICCPASIVSLWNYLMLLTLPSLPLAPSLYLCASRGKKFAIKLELKFNLPKNLKDKLNLIFSARPSQFVNTKYKWPGAGRRQGSGPICSINYTRMALAFDSIYSRTQTGSQTRSAHTEYPQHIREWRA